MVLGLLVGSCAVYRATNQPDRKNLLVLTPGTDRDIVVAELGAPVLSEMEGGGRKEIYTFIQGYSKLTKASRALFHGAADVFSIGLWEAVGTPIEGALDGKRISVKILYDERDKVKDAKTLTVEDPKSPNQPPEPARFTHGSS
jgi:outer membrane protein assembly factor BamE (lipoprotein component of BamABCDE complex)